MVVYSVYYQTSSGSLRMTWGNVSTTSVTVTNLSPATEYVITVVAQNGLYGDERNRSTSVNVITSSMIPGTCGVSMIALCNIYNYNY